MRLAALLLIFPSITVWSDEGSLTWWRAERDVFFVPLLYKDIGYTHIQCTGTIISIIPVVHVLVAGTCLYDDWGNFLHVPESLIVEILRKPVDVTKIIPHPRFWFGNTQNNIAILEVVPDAALTVELKSMIPFTPVIANDLDEPHHCALATFNVQNKGFNVDPTNVVDRDKFCYRQMFPLSLRLRNDNICATIPVYGVRPEHERRYAGAPIVCVEAMGLQNNDTTATSGEEKPYVKWILHATLSFNYRCENRLRVAVFTTTSYHRQFIVNPENFIDRELTDFKLRQGISLKKSTSPTSSLLQFWLLFNCMILCSFFSSIRKDV